MEAVTKTCDRLLLASVHDVSPRFEGEVDRLIDQLAPAAGGKLALLVVPNHWGDAPIVAGSRFAARLRRWADDGLEIMLHGYFHRDDSKSHRGTDRIRAKWLTAGEGEFLGLSRAEASDRIDRGRALLESIIGRSIDGFVAPAWLYGDGARQALAEAQVPVAESHWRVWSPATGRELVRGPVITWATRTRMRRASSLAAAAMLRRSAARVLRLGVHPPDCRDDATMASIASTLRVAARKRRAAAYRDLMS
jgi:predicted deacetylase